MKSKGGSLRQQICGWAFLQFFVLSWNVILNLSLVLCPQLIRRLTRFTSSTVKTLKRKSTSPANQHQSSPWLKDSLFFKHELMTIYLHYSPNGNVVKIKKIFWLIHVEIKFLFKPLHLVTTNSLQAGNVLPLFHLFLNISETFDSQSHLYTYSYLVVSSLEFL